MTDNVIETFLKNGGAGVKAIEGVSTPAIVIGDACKIESLEPFLAAPLAIKSSRKFDDLRGFVGYINDFKTPETAIFAGKERIEVVFDHHSKDAPRWGKHVITFSYQRSARWNVWEKNNNKWMTQKDFADFLDSGLNEVVESEHGGILSVVKDFRATVKADVEAEIAQGGGTNFVYRQEVKGGARKTDVMVPEYIGIQVAPFEGIGALNSLIHDSTKQVPTFMFKGKICWRLNEQDKPEFKVQLLHFENAVEETLEALRVAMESLTECKVYIGG